METQNAIKLIKELKANKFLPKFNVINIQMKNRIGPRTARGVSGDLI